MFHRFAQLGVMVAGLLTVTAAPLEANQDLLRATARAINDAKSGQCVATIKPAENRIPPLTVRMLWLEGASRVERLVGEKAISWGPTAERELPTELPFPLPLPSDHLALNLAIPAAEVQRFVAVLRAKQGKPQ